jgi:lipopolysaccharide export system protein LptA
VRSLMRVESTEAPDARARSTGTTPGAEGTAIATATPRKGSSTMATAGALVYDDAERRATYTTSARMVGEHGDLRGNKIEVFFDPSGKGLERLEAYETVAFRSALRPDGSARWGYGARITYFADDERYVLSGPRANVIEQLPKECRETVGQTLTFYKATDSILVDGQTDRTLTRASTQCPGQVP